ncbi:MAG: SagB/ThcOx family dehydrogenase [Methanobacterium sp.]|uniref:SagB/ThcOx family dehydrogenase n=1 Tax=Methanobacterium sp. TaxID=2164 RepID=UPI003D653F66|nr:SagB/ThcOx family dehydrogenase [Methanobacterium sp.]
MSTKGKIALIILIILLFAVIAYLIWPKPVEYSSRTVIGTVDLPNPKFTGSMSVEQAIHDRRSVRKYTNESLTLNDVSQLLWAAYGVTEASKNFKTVPSGGHTYPLEIYLIVGNGSVKGLDSGFYHYVPQNHSLEKILDGDLREKFAKASHNQLWIKEAPVNIVITGNDDKMMNKYKDNKLSIRFVDIEAGHSGQNIYLQAQAMNLATVAIGSFYEDQVINILHLPSNERIIYSFPVGHSAK